MYSLILLFITVSYGQEIIMDPSQPEKSKNDSLVTLPDLDLRSYAGYFDISHRNHSKLFFWFFESTNISSPLIVWLQGQPGLSSLFSLFEEHGPYKITSKKITRRKKALTDKYHVLYLDPETCCGFSYKNDDIEMHHTMEHISHQIYETLIQFFQIFPEQVSNPLYLAGESGAHFVIPHVIQHIWADSESKSLFNFEGFIIGGGIFLREGSFHLVHSLFRYGLIDTKTEQMLREPQEMLNARIHASKYTYAMEMISNMVSSMHRITGHEDIYDIRHRHSTLRNDISSVFTPQFRSAIHVGSRQFQNRTDPLVADLLKPVEELYVEMLSATRILLYNAQYDLSASYTQTLRYLGALEWPGAREYYKLQRKPWLSNGKLIGYWKTTGNLTHVFIRDAGHFVGKTHCDILLKMIANFIDRKFH